MCLLAEWWLPGRSPHSHPRPTRQEAVDVTRPPSLVAYLSSCDLSGLDALRSTRESTISFSPFFFPQLVYNNVLSPFYTRVTTPPSFRQYFILRFFKTFLTRAYRSDDRSAKSKSVKSGGESFNHRFGCLGKRSREREEKKKTTHHRPVSNPLIPSCEKKISFTYRYRSAKPSRSIRRATPHTPPFHPIVSNLPRRVLLHSPRPSFDEPTVEESPIHTHIHTETREMPALRSRGWTGARDGEEAIYQA